MRTFIRILAIFITVGSVTSAQTVVTDDEITSHEEPDIAFDVFDVPKGNGTVTNGVRVEFGQYPSIVLLKLPGGRCTGTLISPTLVLTAGHCVRKRDGSHHAKITVGFYPLNAADRPRSVSVRVSGNAVVHPGYILPTTPNLTMSQYGASDLALLRLPTEAPQASKRVTPIATSAARHRSAAIMIAGYGQLFKLAGGRAQGFLSNTPMVGRNISQNGIDQRVILLEGRRKLAGKIVTVAVCFGDSGGPTYALSDDTRPDDPGNLTVIGVNSQINPGDNDFNEFKFNDDGDYDSDRCLADGIGSVSAGLVANYPMLRAMAQALGESL